MVRNMLFAVLLAVCGSGMLYGQMWPIPTSADSQIVFGRFDGADADQPGEVSFNLGGVVSGMPLDSLTFNDTIVVDSVFGFSSIESLMVMDVGNAKNYDTIYIPYWFQNYGNTNQDNFVFNVRIQDTSDAGHFTPTDFDLVSDTSGADMLQGIASKDSAEWLMTLPEGAVDTVFIRVVIPAIDSAADQDSIRLIVTVLDQYGMGTNDWWPYQGFGSGKIVIDTAGFFVHTSMDTLMDYGDIQTDTVAIAIGGPVIKVRARTVAFGAFTGPGDTLQYNLYFDNDGSAATQDTGVFTALLPKGTMFLDTVQSFAGNGAYKYLQYRCYGMWIDHIPAGWNIMGRDSLLNIDAVQMKVAPGIAAQNGGDMMSMITADDSTDIDAGVMRFKVRIR